MWTVPVPKQQRGGAWSDSGKGSGKGRSARKVTSEQIHATYWSACEVGHKLQIFNHADGIYLNSVYMGTASEWELKCCFFAAFDKTPNDRVGEHTKNVLLENMKAEYLRLGKRCEGKTKEQQTVDFGPLLKARMEQQELAQTKVTAGGSGIMNFKLCVHEGQSFVTNFTNSSYLPNPSNPWKDARGPDGRMFVHDPVSGQSIYCDTLPGLATLPVPETVPIPMPAAPAHASAASASALPLPPAAGLPLPMQPSTPPPPLPPASLQPVQVIVAAASQAAMPASATTAGCPPMPGMVQVSPSILLATSEVQPQPRMVRAKAPPPPPSDSEEESVLPYYIEGSTIIKKDTKESKELPPPGNGWALFHDSTSDRCYLANKAGSVMWVHKLFRQKPVLQENPGSPKRTTAQSSGQAPSAPAAIDVPDASLADSQATLHLGAGAQIVIADDVDEEAVKVSNAEANPADIADEVPTMGRPSSVPA